MAVELEALRESGDPVKAQLAVLEQQIAELRSEMMPRLRDAEVSGGNLPTLTYP